jgi:predicted nucleic acid-binding protein
VRVFGDTNFWLAVLLHRGFCRKLWRHTRRDHRFVVCPEVLAELREKLGGKFALAPRPAEAPAALVARWCDVAASPVNVERVRRDPDDDAIAHAAWIAACEVVITGDRDLLVSETWRGVRFLTPRAWADEVSAGRPF